MSSQKQISTLSGQVETLSAINATLQRYLEAVISKVSPENAAELIQTERQRLSEIELLDELRQNDFFRQGFMSKKPTVEQFRDALAASGTLEEFANKLAEITDVSELREEVMIYEGSEGPIRDLNECRKLLDKPLFPLHNDEAITKPSSGRRKRGP